ncbi:MAG: hypothetical protein KAJ31_08690 [Deltaproteobacteria bacterium]|nr:hypothetical protein [Deltaproteobacteria bacterium]
MTKIPSRLVKNYLSPLLGLVVLVFVFSCSSQGDSKSSIEKLAAYCIRECVLETSDSQICDTECKCAAKKLSGEFSKEKFINLVQNITETNGDDSDAILKLSKALEICKANDE